MPKAENGMEAQGGAPQGQPQGQPQGDPMQQVMQMAQQMAQDGADPIQIAQALMQQGVPPEAIGQVLVQLGMPEEQVQQVIQQVMQGGQEDAPQDQPQEGQPMMYDGGEAGVDSILNYMADGGQEAQQNQGAPQEGVDPMEQVMQMAQQMAQEGADPMQIVQALMEQGVPADAVGQVLLQLGVPEEQIQQILQQVTQNAPQEAQQGEQPMMAEGGQAMSEEEQQKQLQQLIIMFAEIQGQNPEEILQALQEAEPEKQQEMLQQMATAVEQSNPQGQSEQMMAKGGQSSDNCPKGYYWSSIKNECVTQDELKQIHHDMAYTERNSESGVYEYHPEKLKEGYDNSGNVSGGVFNRTIKHPNVTHNSRLQKAYQEYQNSEPGFVDGMKNGMYHVGSQAWGGLKSMIGLEEGGQTGTTHTMPNGETMPGAYHGVTQQELEYMKGGGKKDFATIKRKMIKGYRNGGTTNINDIDNNTVAGHFKDKKSSIEKYMQAGYAVNMVKNLDNDVSKKFNEIPKAVEGMENGAKDGYDPVTGQYTAPKWTPKEETNTNWMQNYNRNKVYPGRQINNNPALNSYYGQRFGMSNVGSLYNTIQNNPKGPGNVTFKGIGDQSGKTLEEFAGAIGKTIEVVDEKEETFYKKKRFGSPERRAQDRKNIFGNKKYDYTKKTYSTRPIGSSESAESDRKWDYQNFDELAEMAGLDTENNSYSEEHIFKIAKEKGLLGKENGNSNGEENGNKQITGTSWNGEPVYTDVNDPNYIPPGQGLEENSNIPNGSRRENRQARNRDWDTNNDEELSRSERNAGRREAGDLRKQERMAGREDRIKDRNSRRKNRRFGENYDVEDTYGNENGVVTRSSPDPSMAYGQNLEREDNADAKAINEMGLPPGTDFNKLSASEKDKYFGLFDQYYDSDNVLSRNGYKVQDSNVPLKAYGGELGSPFKWDTNQRRFLPRASAGYQVDEYGQPVGTDVYGDPTGGYEVNQGKDKRTKGQKQQIAAGVARAGYNMGNKFSNFLGAVNDYVPSDEKAVNRAKQFQVMDTDSPEGYYADNLQTGLFNNAGNQASSSGDNVSFGQDMTNINSPFVRYGGLIKGAKGMQKGSEHYLTKAQEGMLIKAGYKLKRLY